MIAFLDDAAQCLAVAMFFLGMLAGVVAALFVVIYENERVWKRPDDEFRNWNRE